MEEALYFDDKKYISSKRASDITGYAKDYVGQLCRGGKIDARRIGRNWFVAEASILQHKDSIAEQLEETYAQMRTTKSSSSIVAQVAKEDKSDEKDVEKNVPSSFRVRPPVPLSEFAKTRLPTPSEIARHYGGKRALASMNITYNDATPLYYEDDRPLNPQPRRSTTYYGDSPITHIIEPRETVHAIHNSLAEKTAQTAVQDTAPQMSNKDVSQFVPVRTNVRATPTRKPVAEIRTRRAATTRATPRTVPKEKQSPRSASRQQSQIPRQYASTTSRLQYVAAAVFFLVVALGTYVVLGADFVTRVDMSTADAVGGAASSELRFRDMF